MPQALADGLRRFATGMYAVWYPQLQRAEFRQLPDKLKRATVKSWLHISLTVKTPAADCFGMHGSGMFIVNPPWTLHDTLKEVMPYLVQVLRQDSGANYCIEQGTIRTGD